LQNRITAQKIPTRAAVYFCLKKSLILTHGIRQFEFGISPSTPSQIPNSTLAANIRKRRGSKVAINVPLFIDKGTPRPFVDPTIPWQRDVYPEDAGTGLFVRISCRLIDTLPIEAKIGAALMDHIYMDAMGFGSGCCCLQLTFQCCNVNEARQMYDALIPISPLMV